MSAYTNLKLNIKSLKIIIQTQDKADKPQAKNEKKKKKSLAKACVTLIIQLKLKRH